MEITKENLFNIKYNAKKDVIELVDKKNKMKMFLRRNKFILSIIGTTTLMVTVNIFLIESFYKILLTL